MNELICIYDFFDANQNKNINQIHKTINIGQICIGYKFDVRSKSINFKIRYGAREIYDRSIVLNFMCAKKGIKMNDLFFFSMLLLQTRKLLKMELKRRIMKVYL